MKRYIIAIGLVLVASLVFADGGGGFFRGRYFYVPEYSNVETEATVSGGFGYGAQRRGSRYGGFGLSINDAETDRMIGAFGGFISGNQIRTGPVTLSLNLWSGLGYVNPDFVESEVGVGYFAEANAEAGFAFVPWFQVSFYAGMQAIGSFDPAAFLSSARYSPVMGTRFTWGGF